MSPPTQYMFSSSICVITRDDQQMLSFRVCHPHGHCCTNLVWEASWVHNECTKEGENYGKLTPVTLNTGSSLMHLPRTITHVIDEESPFWSYRDALYEAHGHLEILVYGRDQYMNCEFSDSWIYNVPDVCHFTTHRWEDMFGERGPDGMMLADLDKIDGVIHATPPPDDVLDRTAVRAKVPGTIWAAES